jgi:hypothetical protein
MACPHDRQGARLQRAKNDSPSSRSDEPFLNLVGSEMEAYLQPHGETLPERGPLNLGSCSGGEGLDLNEDPR